MSQHDHLPRIKRDYTDQGLGVLMGEIDIQWLVKEIELLRAENSNLRAALAAESSTPLSRA